MYGAITWHRMNSGPRDSLKYKLISNYIHMQYIDYVIVFVAVQILYNCRIVTLQIDFRERRLVRVWILPSIPPSLPPSRKKVQFG